MLLLLLFSLSFRVGIKDQLPNSSRIQDYQSPNLFSPVTSGDSFSILEPNSNDFMNFDNPASIQDDSSSDDDTSYVFRRIRFRFPKSQSNMRAIEIISEGEVIIEDSIFSQTAGRIRQNSYCGVLANYLTDVDAEEGPYLIQTKANSVTITNITVTYLDSNDLYGAIKLTGNGAHIITRCMFRNTNSTGAIYYCPVTDSPDDSLNISQCTFRQCLGSNGCFYVKCQHSISITSCVFEGCFDMDSMGFVD